MIEVSTIADFQKEVLEVPGPVLVQFYADWCAPCRNMHEVLDELIRLEPGKFKLVKVNTNGREGGSLHSKYGERNPIPQFVVFRDGARVGGLIGFNMRGPFWRWLEPLLK